MRMSKMVGMSVGVIIVMIALVCVPASEARPVDGQRIDPDVAPKPLGFRDILYAPRYGEPVTECYNATFSMHQQCARQKIKWDVNLTDFSPPCIHFEPALVYGASDECTNWLVNMTQVCDPTSEKLIRKGHYECRDIEHWDFAKNKTIVTEQCVWEHEITEKSQHAWASGIIEKMIGSCSGFANRYNSTCEYTWNHWFDEACGAKGFRYREDYTQEMKDYMLIDFACPDDGYCNVTFPPHVDAGICQTIDDFPAFETEQLKAWPSIDMAAKIADYTKQFKVAQTKCQECDGWVARLNGACNFQRWNPWEDTIPGFKNIMCDDKSACNYVVQGVYRNCVSGRWKALSGVMFGHLKECERLFDEEESRITAKPKINFQRVDKALGLDKENSAGMQSTAGILAGVVAAVLALAM